MSLITRFEYLNNFCLINTSEFMGKTFQAVQLTHERFLTIGHSCKEFFWYLPNWTSTDLWCVVLYVTYILQEWSMVKNLSCVSCAAWNVLPINSLLCPRPGQARIDYLAPLFDDNTIILKNDDRRFIVLLSEYVPCTYFHKNNKSQLDIPFVLEI